MDHVRIGRSIRVVRIRRRIRQCDLAALASLSQQTVSRIERGRLHGVTIGTLEQVCAELGIRLSIELRWEGAELDRLLGARHSAMHDAVARLFETLPEWVQSPEVTFAIFGERGAIDILAWHATSRTLLVIELKTEIVDVQETVGTLDRKRRLATKVAAERGWVPASISAWLLIADSPTNRRRVRAHLSMLRSAFPVDGRGILGWLRAPRGAVSAMSFLSPTPGVGGSRQFAPVCRVRRPRPSVGTSRS